MDRMEPGDRRIANAGAGSAFKGDLAPLAAVVMNQDLADVAAKHFGNAHNLLFHRFVFLGLPVERIQRGLNMLNAGVAPIQSDLEIIAEETAAED